MRITEVATVLLSGPCTDDRWLLPFKQQRSVALIELRTDDRYIGVGETYAGYFFPEGVQPIVDYLSAILLNAEDVRDVPTLVQRMRTCCAYWGRVGLGAAVIAGIEAALWDLRGKLDDAPVYALLGGSRHDRLPAYATGGPAIWPEEQLLAKIESYLGHGFTAVKVSSGYLDPNSREEVQSDDPVGTEVGKVAAVRERFGPELKILLDGHMGHREGPDRWDVETAAAVLAALEPYDVFFFEEPLPYSDLSGYATLTGGSTIPVAGGEQLTTRAEFQLFADHDALAIAQPDAAWIGLGDFLDVAKVFAASGRSIAPHAWGAGGAVLQNLHGAFAAPAVSIVELPPDPGPLHRELWGDSFRMVDGQVLPPTGSGMGTQLTEAIKRSFPYQPGLGEFSSVPGKIMRS